LLPDAITALAYSVASSLRRDYTMKLAPCPDCKTMCSVMAATCPKCGRVFKEGERAAQQKEFEAKVAADSRRSLIIAGVVTVVLLIFFLIGNSAR
jgi:uncharacterized membrane protein YvbJ